MNFDDMLPDHVAAPEQKVIVWSPLQEAIFLAIENDDENLIAEAVAGSGKTATIVEASKRLPSGSDNLFLAFNKSIVNTLASKLPYSCTCKTLNSLGHGLMMRKLRSLGASPALNNYRMWDIARTILTEDQWEEYGSGIIRMVSLARAHAVGIHTPNEEHVYRSMLGDYEVDIPIQQETLAARQAVEILRRMISTITEGFDFDDQLYMPVYWESTFPQFDTVFIDEAQDLSTIQHIMLERLADRGARIIGVGDSRQAIYGFRGADTASMTNMSERFNADLYPLSISYRCPKTVVAEAQKLVYHITAHESAPEGSVTYLDEAPEVKDYPATCMVLCRTNAPIFALALEFLQAKLPCNVMSNFGKDIIKFVKSFEVKSTADLQEMLLQWKDKEVARAEARGWYGKANAARDKVEALLPFCEAFDLKVQVVAGLQQLLTTHAGPTLATIHKAKGLEAPTVYILRPDLLPAPFAKTEAQIEQEHNLKYVAITRAQEHLIFLPEEV